MFVNVFDNMWNTHLISYIVYIYIYTYLMSIYCLHMYDAYGYACIHIYIYTHILIYICEHCCIMNEIMLIFASYPGSVVILF